jgi:hypothetical protein
MPEQMNHTAERRHRRSDNPLQALSYQLDDTARGCGLDALVLADRDGLFIAGGGERQSRAEGPAVASLCPLVVREGGNCYDGGVDVPGDRDLSVLMFSYKGQTLYLGAVARRMQVRSNDAILGAMEGVVRILG